MGHLFMVQRGGASGVRAGKAPLADARETHGICPVHLHQMGAGRDQLVLCYGDSSLPRHEAVFNCLMHSDACYK